MHLLGESSSQIWCFDFTLANPVANVNWTLFLETLLHLPSYGKDATKGTFLFIVVCLNTGSTGRTRPTKNSSVILSCVLRLFGFWASILASSCVQLSVIFTVDSHVPELCLLPACHPSSRLRQSDVLLPGMFATEAHLVLCLLKLALYPRGSSCLKWLSCLYLNSGVPSTPLVVSIWQLSF